MNWKIIIEIVLFAPFGFSYLDEEYYEVRTYDVEEGSIIIYPIPMPVLRKSSLRACWKGEPPLVTVCCFHTSIPARGQSACYRDYEYDIEKHDPSVYFEITARAKEATLYYLVIPYSKIYVCFYLIEVGALNEDKYNVISALRNNVIGQIIASNDARSSFTFNFFCPNTFKHKIKVLLYPGGTSVNAYNGHASKDPAYTHYRSEIPSRKNNDYTQVFAYCDDNYSIPVITNIKWWGRPIVSFDHRDSPLLQLIENITDDMYTTFPILIDRFNSGINITCNVTSSTIKVYWSYSIYESHFFVQCRDEQFNSQCKKCSGWYIPGEKPSEPSRFVLQYKPDPEEITQIYCLTYTQNFFPVFYVFGSAKITGDRKEAYDLLKMNNLEMIFKNTSEVLEIRFFIPINYHAFLLVRTNKSRTTFESLTEKAKYSPYDKKYKLMIVNRVFNGFWDEQYILNIPDFKVLFNQYVRWVPLDEEEEDGEEKEVSAKLSERNTNPSTEPGVTLRWKMIELLSVSGEMIELLPDEILQVSDDEKLAITITILCIAGIAASYAVATFYLFFFGFRKFEEDMKAEMKEEINDEAMAENISKVNVAADNSAKGKNEDRNLGSLSCLRRQKKAEYSEDTEAVNEEKSTKSTKHESVEMKESSYKIEKVKAE